MVVSELEMVDGVPQSIVEGSSHSICCVDVSVGVSTGVSVLAVVLDEVVAEVLVSVEVLVDLG